MLAAWDVVTILGSEAGVVELAAQRIKILWAATPVRVRVSPSALTTARFGITRLYCDTLHATSAAPPRGSSPEMQGDDCRRLLTRLAITEPQLQFNLSDSYPNRRLAQ